MSTNSFRRLHRRRARQSVRIAVFSTLPVVAAGALAERASGVNNLMAAVAVAMLAFAFAAPILEWMVLVPAIVRRRS